jgi:LacI family transcriptional regulator
VDTSPSRRRATLDDIAALSGVSRATVSKVLNRRSGFTPATRAAVEKAVRDTGYVPITRERRMQESGAILIVFDTLFSLYSLKLLDGVAEGAQDAGVDLITQVMFPNSARAASITLNAHHIKTIADKGHAGVLVVTSVITPETVALFAEYGVPLLAIDAQTALQNDVVSVGSNHWGGGMQAAKHLVDLGHRRIAFVGGHRDNPALRERYTGFREVLEGAGIEIDPTLVSEEGFGSGFDAVARMLRAPHPPTAVFASNDADAFGAVRAIAEAGLRMPEDVSVVGYDDTYAEVSPIRFLTTVHAPLHEIGRVAVATLLGLSRGEQPISPRVELATSLVVRDSTRAVG